MPNDNLSQLESVVEVNKVTLVLCFLATHERANFIFVLPSRADAKFVASQLGLSSKKRVVNTTIVDAS